jgi:hypothetical protein
MSRGPGIRLWIYANPQLCLPGPRADQHPPADQHAPANHHTCTDPPAQANQTNTTTNLGAARYPTTYSIAPTLISLQRPVDRNCSHGLTRRWGYLAS